MPVLGQPSVVTTPRAVKCPLSPLAPLRLPPLCPRSQSASMIRSPFQRPRVALRCPKRARSEALITTHPGPLRTTWPPISYGGSR